MPIQGGEFVMGSPTTEKGRQPEEGPQHNVFVADFHMACCEVTQKQYQAIMGENPSGVIGANCPVDWVSWEEAQEFINKLNSINNTKLRLPAESE